ncbi:hypothetical protein G7Y79_00006g018800 [Physcia stellaris]|nr:hypothetical protein G7Y79_00006g018800 [Physcia stellaris]
MASLLRRWGCDSDSDCNHTFTSSVTTIIIIVVVILVVKICLIVTICTVVKRRRARALRPYTGGAPNQAYGGGGAQVPNYGAQQEPPPGYYEMDRAAPEGKGGEGRGHGVLMLKKDVGESVHRDGLSCG